jgi:hypothetical protein
MKRVTKRGNQTSTEMSGAATIDVAGVDLTRDEGTSSSLEES